MRCDQYFKIKAKRDYLPALEATGWQSKGLGMAWLANSLLTSAPLCRTRKQHPNSAAWIWYFNWSLATQFSGTWRTSHCLRIGYAGFGASEKAVVTYKTGVWVEQVYDFWRTFIRQPVILVGNSIGSLVALAAAFSHPEMVQGIVMLSLPDPALEEEATPKF
jgi:hypothetical protein